MRQTSCLIKTLLSLVIFISFGGTSVIASPQLSVQQLNTFSQLCNASISGLAINKAQTGLLIFDTQLQIDSAHDLLNSDIQASSFNTTGLLLCAKHKQIEIDECSFFLFDVPRIRHDIELNLLSVRSPQNSIASMTLSGSPPPSCNDAGVITSSTKNISGPSPSDEEIMSFVDNFVLSQDSDADKVSDIDELIAGTAPFSSDSAVISLLVTVNGSTQLDIPEGDALTLAIDFEPAAHFQKPGATYRLWVDTEEGIFSYKHPKGFFLTDTPETSAKGKGLRLKNYKIGSFPAFGKGDYLLHFEVDIGQNTYRSEASFSVVENFWNFQDVTEEAGISYTHGFVNPNNSKPELQWFTAGVAAGDYDNDGWIDLYVTQDSTGSNRLYRNKRDGTFEEVGEAAGVSSGVPEVGGVPNEKIELSGATFADVDGDGWLDILVSGIKSSNPPMLYHNNQDGTFSDASAIAKLPVMSQNYSTSFADYDKDGDLDFWITHWQLLEPQQYLFRQNDDGSFTDVSAEAGIQLEGVWDYTANFSDIDNDGWLDILVSADFGTSQIYMNQQDGTFKKKTKNALTDRFGMGGAVGDFDNDSDLDWFVTSIYETTRELDDFDGNRFYTNNGDGSFSDTTYTTRTGKGGWGWGTCFADFNNDMYLDLYQVNGYYDNFVELYDQFTDDRSLLFVNDQNNSFIEQARWFGVADRGQGRGIVCFDYDKDGDIDIFIANNKQAPKLYQNQGINKHWLHIEVAGEDLNSQAIGARVYVTANEITQMRELNAGSNFMSQNPVIAYFGLDDISEVDQVRVVWPSGDERILTNISADQTLYVNKE